jgi:hypothetical protein
LIVEHCGLHAALYPHLWSRNSICEWL